MSGRRAAAKILSATARRSRDRFTTSAAVPFREEDVACFDVADAAAGTNEIDLGVGHSRTSDSAIGREVSGRVNVGE
jgi:hypothetical protein